MTALWIEHAGARWRVAVEHAIDLSIPLDFAGPQPSFFHAPPAHSTPLEMGSFVGDVARGGSCNCATVTLTPHCNGTHTECVGHIVDEAITVATVAPLTPLPCRLVTVAPRPLARSAD
ncbi:MAG TPA: hypothetical protein VLT59_05560, partial [Steroidobacteraceae bacterium]|nr:hypothetical protein [Steroidobacteraceae bacterium]